jgi:hypothetical protein
MIKRSISLLLAFVLLNIAAGRCFAGSASEKEIRHANKVKQDILKLGVGKDARIAIRLRDKSKLAGYISEVKDDSFVLTDLKTGESNTVPYGDVTQARGNNLSTGAKVAIGVGIAIAVLIIILYALNAGGIRYS